MTEETTAAPAAEETAAATSTEPARDFEAEARAGGWKPESEWSGDKKPAKFLSAQEFVERGEELAPFLRKENKRLQERLARVERDNESRFEKLSRVTQATQDRLIADHERQISELKTAQRKAVEAGDTAEFDRLDKQRDKLEASKPEEIIVEDPKKTDIDGEFKKNNTWYGVDKDMTRIAVGESQELSAQNPGMSIEENLRQTEAYMRKNYPQLYGGQAQTKTAANGHAAVDGGGAFPGSGGGKPDPLSKLPNEARHQAKIDMAKYPKIYPDAASWIKAYEGK